MPDVTVLLFSWRSRQPPALGIAAAVPARGHRCQRSSSAAKDPIGKSKQKREKKKAQSLSLSRSDRGTLPDPIEHQVKKKKKPDR
jgi:hypothetical protein